MPELGNGTLETEVQLEFAQPVGLVPGSSPTVTMEGGCRGPTCKGHSRGVDLKEKTNPETDSQRPRTV